MSGSFNMDMNGNVWVCKGENVISGKVENWKNCKSVKMEKSKIEKLQKWKSGKETN